jgi:hypothetical protein
MIGDATFATKKKTMKFGHLKLTVTFALLLIGQVFSTFVFAGTLMSFKLYRQESDDLDSEFSLGSVEVIDVTIAPDYQLSFSSYRLRGGLTIQIIRDEAIVQTEYIVPESYGSDVSFQLENIQLAEYTIVVTSDYGVVYSGDFSIDSI